MLQEIVNEINSIKDQGFKELAELKSSDQLPEWFRDYLGKKGRLTSVLKRLGKLSREDRPKVGQITNEVKTELAEKFEARQEQIKGEDLAREVADDDIDVSLPGRPAGRGRLHLCTQTLRQIYSIFGEMGFQVYEAPEVETDENNFQLLNIPEYHPARDMWDTFWVNDEVVMRTHTSPGQIRAMREFSPDPIRVILPGKTYRYEQITPRSEHQFFQVEGMAIGHDIKMTDLIGLMEQFAKKMYGEDRKVRIRGSYFPFTEPSVEIDMDCILCAGEGCRVCKYTNWLEIGGAGMMHPVVLRNGGYDPEEWSGIAFGLGVERPAMLKHNISDIRHFYANDLSFTDQF